VTRDQFLEAIRAIAIARLKDPAARARVTAVKLSYGMGHRTRFGICVFKAWTHDNGQADFVEISACTELSALQLAETVLHELAHSLAGWSAGHGPKWRATAHTLGLACPKAAGSDNSPDAFAPEVLAELLLLGEPTDGRPSFMIPVEAEPGSSPVCPIGVGIKGGKSRGPGSGSRLRLFICDCNPPVRARVARNEFLATCRICGGAFKRTHN
jgi:hypothetical protein